MGPANRPSQDLPFINVTGDKKPNSETRKIIRSHVMRGKNKGRTLPTRRTKQDNSPGEQDQSQVQVQVQVGEYSNGQAPYIPRNISTDLSFFQPVDDSIDTSLLAKFFTLLAEAKKTMFLLEPRVDFGNERMTWHEVIATDAAYLNAAVFSSIAYFDFLNGADPIANHLSPVCYKHMAKSLRLLRTRLSGKDDSAKISDATTRVVLLLATIYCRMGQYETAASHMRGLRKIVDLRGGITRLRGTSKLLLEIFRCDLGIALDSGADPVFFQDPFMEPFMPYLDRLSGFIPSEFRASDSRRPIHGNTLGINNPELIQAWDMTMTFCSLIHYARKCNRKIPQQTLLNTMASVMYRLLHMRLPCHTVDDAVCITLLAFCSHVFLQWSKLKTPQRYLTNIYRDCLLSLTISDQVAPQTVFWLLMIGSVSVLPKEDDSWLLPWLHDTARTCGFETWEEAQSVLMNYPWVDFIHDDLGADAFNSVLGVGVSGSSYTTG